MSINMLNNKILEAESISISNIIDAINMHARGYLDCFFNDSFLKNSLHHGMAAFGNFYPKITSRTYKSHQLLLHFRILKIRAQF